METIYPFEVISSDLMIIINKIADLLPTQINDALSWMRDHIPSIITIPIIKNTFEYFFYIMFLLTILFVSIYIKIYLSNKADKIKQYYDQLSNKYPIVPYGVTCAYIILTLILLYNYKDKSSNEFLFIIAISPVICYFVLWISEYIDLRLYELPLRRKFKELFKPISTHPIGSNIVILLDVSNSMNKERKIEIAMKELKALLRKLKDRENKIGIVTFGGADRVEKYPITDNYSDLSDKIDKFKAGGTTPMFKAIESADIMLKNQDKINAKNNYKKIYMITDGIPNGFEGEDIKILNYIKDIKYEIDVLGIGEDVNREFLKKIGHNVDFFKSTNSAK